jgi:hypothetical protein
MDKLFLRIFGQELFNVFIVELIMILTVALIFFLVLVVLYAVSWLWKIGIVLAIIFGVKTAHERAMNKLELIESTPVILHD